jgi:predicted PurR-regulated permease PerM
MAFFGAAMMAGMIAGGISQSIDDSYANVVDTCNALNNANEQLDKLKTDWQKVFSKEEKETVNLENFMQGLENQVSQIGVTTLMMKETFKQKKLSVLIALSISTFVIVLFLLLKYFKVFDKMWDFVMNPSK